MDSDDLTKLWYIWFILIIMGTLLMCGIIAGCVKMCCRSSKPPVPTCPGQRFEVAVIDVENRSALSSISTMSSFSHRLPGEPSPRIFTAGLRSPLSPPPYSLYAMESPPQYDEALKMPADKTVVVPRALEDPHVAPEVSGVQESVDTVDRQQPARDDPPESESQNATSYEEEEPPEYHLHDPMAEENFTEISLTEP
ncbi:transmembrane protein 52 [Paramormyrops kingsleyae]|uniref:Transmembrane protein 52 n=1 Tax=Paramormyrops kingsleyae TaxID=1676925 RepID=A0A3B3SPP5_9TELE|nr:transmembrane protein 52 [Paramormyrops kingsleyae]